jgi:UDP-GlcNAc:undecaprenyl-phosphate GlcNAc-1-phosphate transferase
MMWLVMVLMAIGFGWLWTRVARDCAIRIGLVDRPDGRRKMQTGAIPLAGGIGVLLGAVSTLIVGSLIYPAIAENLGGAQQTFLFSLFASSIVIATVGVLDDLYSLRARYKLLGQILASLILIIPGQLVIRQIAVFGWTVDLGLLEIPFTIFWFLAAINALNLLDGMDGLLGTVGVIIFAVLAAMAFFVTFQNEAVGWVAIAMAGALIGFLRYNLPPASVYLGDCGSMLIGLVVAAVAIKSTLKGPAIALVAPTVVLTLPIMDTAAAIIRRKLTGRGLANPDRGHLHHVLQRNGLSIRRALLLVALLGVIAGGGALISIYIQNDLIALGSAGAVVLILFLGGLFGNAEYRLVRERTVAILKRASGGHSEIETEVRLHGSAEWSEVWKVVTDSAEQLNLQTICLDVNAPAWHEDYHVRWDRCGGPTAPSFTLWKAEIPLFGHGQTIGRLTVIGPRDEMSVAEKLAALSRLVESAETRMVAVAPSGSIPYPTPKPSATEATPVPA